MLDYILKMEKRRLKAVSRLFPLVWLLWRTQESEINPLTIFSFFTAKIVKTQRFHNLFWLQTTARERRREKEKEQKTATSELFTDTKRQWIILMFTTWRQWNGIQDGFACSLLRAIKLIVYTNKSNFSWRKRNQKRHQKSLSVCVDEKLFPPTLE